MLENRPIVAITIGYLIGIIMGLYFKISIVPLYFGYFIFQFIYKPHVRKFKLISIRRYFRYVKLCLTKKVFIIILVSSIISNTITLCKNSEFERFQNNTNKQEIQIQAKVISNENIKSFKKMYIVKAKNKKIYLKVSKNVKIDYGDFVLIKGTFVKPKQRTNYKGFDYREYLKSKEIYGTINCKEVHIISKNKIWYNQIFLKVKRLIQRDFNKETSDILLGTILGYTDDIDENLKENFNQSNILHILAVSGMHIGYLLLFCTVIFDNLIGKKMSKYGSILVLFFYIKIIGYSPSAVRATIMAIMLLSSKVLYRKSDVWTNLSVSLLIMLIYNPFIIDNSGLLLSFVATIGILTYMKKFNFKNKIYNLIGITFSATIFIVPIMTTYFNKIPVLSLCISLVIGVISGPIIFLGYIYIMLNSFLKLGILKSILNLLIKILIFLAKCGGKMPLNQMYVATPNLIEILLYYLFIFMILFFISIYNPKRKQNKVFNKRMRNLISLAKYRFNQNKNGIISISIIIVFVFTIIKVIPSNLKIFFIDVGQGDSCLIVTPQNKKILIDGGGSENYDVGRNVLVPYLLARRIKCLDYIIISHFDTDHIGGVLTVMEELNVNTVIISKQGENSENFARFKKIVNKKHINVKVAKKGDNIKIENNLYFDILWPNSKKLISENALNNNSIVCKLNYRDFSMLFTGDIEEIAEKQILQEYKENLQILNSTVLKVAHHGSKSSSSHDFIDAVKPKVALIGVGENNTFGHPNDGVIKRLDNLRHKNI